MNVQLNNKQNKIKLCCQKWIRTCKKGGGTNMDWMDFNHDGKVDAMEQYMGMELLCGSKEEHEALFGDAGDFDDDDEDSDDFDSDDFDSDDFALDDF